MINFDLKKGAFSAFKESFGMSKVFWTNETVLEYAKWKVCSALRQTDTNKSYEKSVNAPILFFSSASISKNTFDYVYAPQTYVSE